jgi:hypothetical protein
MVDIQECRTLNRVDAITTKEGKRDEETEREADREIGYIQE